MNKPQIIGLAGTFAAGKDTISGVLEEHYGYAHASTSDMVRSIALKRHGSVERPVLFETAQELRAEEGAGALVIEAIRANPQPMVVTGLRSLGEAKEIKKAGGMLVFVDAPVEIRHKRMQSRDRDAETKLSLEEFKAFEEKEMYGGPSDADFNLRGIKEIADIVIDSSQEIDVFIDAALSDMGLKTEG